MVPTVAGLREEVREQLAARLRPRAPGAPVVVMGAGSDDIEPGRRYLATLAEVGLSTPRWPREHGGLGATSEEAQRMREALLAIRGELLALMDEL